MAGLSAIIVVFGRKNPSTPVSNLTVLHLAQIAHQLAAQLPALYAAVQL